MVRVLTLLFASALLPLWAQAPAGAPSSPARNSGLGFVRGTVKDDTGGVIPGAPVTLTDSAGQTKSASAQADGTFVFRGVAPGTYSVSATYSNMQQRTPVSIIVAPGRPIAADIVMTPREQRQEVTVTDTQTNQVNTDPGNNASALVLKQEDLDALPDDPDDLQADLQALAGPSAGPGGAQIYIDGFTGGRLPPKASIREIRINSNPFSAEFDKLGFGRIQIFTKPGSDKFHGQGYYNISDGVWNSRNPFLSENAPFRTQLFGGNLSGPISKKASFFIDFERRNIDDNGIITAAIPTPDFLSSQSYQNYYPTPQRRTTISPRVDYQLSTNNTLSFRYSYLDNNRELTNVGGFNLPNLTVGNVEYPSSGYSMQTTEQTVQIVDTAVLNPHVVNETHFEFDRTNIDRVSSSTAPALNVSQSFVAGGSGYSSAAYPKSYDLDNYYELQNYTSVTWGAHVTKFGMRVRTDVIDDLTPQNFNGQFAFLGGTFPVLGSNFAPTGQLATINSIQQYLITEQLLSTGFSSDYITNQLHYGPSKFAITEGNPYIHLNQMDFGPFLQDDWRVRPNLTVSLGLRYEAQTNIGDHGDWAPRVGFAWAPGGRASSGLSRPKLVIRGGWGIFYDRFAAANVLQAERYALNSGTQQVFSVNNPSVYDAAFSTAPPASSLSPSAAQFYQIDNDLKAPRLMQTVLGLDKQVTSHTTVSFNLMDSRGTHELLTNNINAPIPITGQLPPGALNELGGSSIQPYGDIGDIYDYQSVGIFKQFQAMVNVNSQVGRWLTIFSHYSYTQAHSDTDGLSTMPANPYNIAADWGRAQLDIHHQLFIGGSVAMRWGVRLSPFIVIHSGGPYNITTGTDLYDVGQVAATARPEVSGTTFPGSSYSQKLGLYYTTLPLVGAPVISRNYGYGPGFVGVNLRLSKTFGFGTTHYSGQVGGARAGGGGGFPGGGGGGGHGGGFGGGGGGGGPRFGGGESTEHRYNLTLSVNARNILNHENLNTPNGAITSPFFGESLGITGGFGAEATASNQRRIDFQLRFAF